MAVIRVGENESLDSALKRFKRKCQKDNILGDMRKKEYYEKPSVKRKKKKEAARKRCIGIYGVSHSVALGHLRLCKLPSCAARTSLSMPRLRA